MRTDNIIGRTNAEIPGSDNVTTVHYPTATAGITVTASKTGTTKTAVTDSSGVATFKHLELGYTWTFTDGTDTVTKYLGELTEDIYFAIDVEIFARGNSFSLYHYYNVLTTSPYVTFGNAESIKSISSSSNYTSVGTVKLKVGEYYGTYTQSGGDIVLFYKNSASGESIGHFSTGNTSLSKSNLEYIQMDSSISSIYINVYWD